MKAIFLTGSHHWNNLQDSGRHPAPLTNRFDYDGYLKRLQGWNHYFIRLWAWEGPAWWFQGGQNDQYYEPLPWARVGHQPALDGKPKFELDQFNEDYFKRLRSRVVAARERSIYVSVMLFQGWSIYSHGYGNPWPGHPFNRANNVNGLDGDPNGDGEGKEIHTLQVPTVTRRQEASVRKVIDTVNGLDNVPYETSNVTALWSKDWQYHMIRFVKEYEATKPKQHPVGITAFDSGGEGSMVALWASPADWISPQNDGASGDYQDAPPAADGRRKHGRSVCHHRRKNRSVSGAECAGLGVMPAERQGQTMNRKPNAVMLFESVSNPVDWISPSVAAWNKDDPREQSCT